MELIIINIDFKRQRGKQCLNPLKWSMSVKGFIKVFTVCGYFLGCQENGEHGRLAGPPSTLSFSKLFLMVFTNV